MYDLRFAKSCIVNRKSQIARCTTRFPEISGDRFFLPRLRCTIPRNAPALSGISRFAMCDLRCAIYGVPPHGPHPPSRPHTAASPCALYPLTVPTLRTCSSLVCVHPTLRLRLVRGYWDFVPSGLLKESLQSKSYVFSLKSKISVLS